MPYTPEQNGVAERYNRTIIEGARAMLIDAQLPKKYWLLAMRTMSYLRNRSPTRANNYKTPYEVFYSKKPDLSHVNPFGCEVMVHIPGEHRLKWDAKAWTGRFVGYLKFEGGYCVLNK